MAAAGRNTMEAVKAINAAYLAPVRGGISAFDDIDRQPAKARFLVAALHVLAGLAHGFDYCVAQCTSCSSW
jgi:hypothetical protein